MARGASCKILPGTKIVSSRPKVQQIADMKKLWPALVRHVWHPEVQRHLELIYEDQFAWANSPTDMDLALSQRQFDDIKSCEARTGQKPWAFYPLATMAMVPLQLNHMVMHRYLLAHAKSPADVEWWVWPATCWWLNGNFLLTLLRLAFPDQRYTYVRSKSHGWVEDEHGNYYDLIYPFYEQKEQMIMEAIAEGADQMSEFEPYLAS